MLTFDEIKNIFRNSGLSTSQVADLRTKYGANAMTPPVRDPLWRQYLAKFNDPIIKILLFAVVVSTIVSLIRGEGLLDTIGIIIAVFLATGIAFFNEYPEQQGVRCPECPPGRCGSQGDPGRSPRIRSHPRHRCGGSYPARSWRRNTR